MPFNSGSHGSCCRGNPAALLHISPPGTLVGPSACAGLCSNTTGCRAFSHGRRWNNCQLCSACNLTAVGGNRGYRSWSFGTGLDSPAASWEWWPDNASRTDFALSSFDVRRYDVFTLCSLHFWRERRDLVVGFFAHLRDVNTSGFLVTPSAPLCRDVTASLGVACVSTQSYRLDGALSKERWRVILHCLQRQHRIAYAGLDVRFLHPVRTLLHETGSSQKGSAVDVGFEGAFDRRAGRVSSFTPDLAWGFPTSRAIGFLTSLTSQLRERSLDGLPEYMRREPSLLAYNVMGPAEQDLLRDALLGYLYNRSVAVNKYQLALGGAEDLCRRLGRCVSPHTNASLPECPPGGGRDTPPTSPSHWACGAAAVLGEAALERLPFAPSGLGGVVTSPTLTAFLSDGKGVMSGALACNGARPTACVAPPHGRRPLAIHCGGKDPACLTLAGCPCLRIQL